MRGAPMRAVQELVGHRDFTMTHRYSHLTDGALDEAIKLLDDQTVTSDDGDIVETADHKRLE
jgi:hypothetical protein